MLGSGVKNVPMPREQLQILYALRSHSFLGVILQGVAFFCAYADTGPKYIQNIVKVLIALDLIWIKAVSITSIGGGHESLRYSSLNKDHAFK